MPNQNRKVLAEQERKRVDRLKYVLSALNKVEAGKGLDGENVMLFDFADGTEHHLTTGKSLNVPESSISLEQTRVIIDYIDRLMGAAASERELELELPAPVMWRVDETGKLAPKISPIVETLAGISIRRIKRCGICNDLFYAVRDAQRGCNALHSNRLSVRACRPPRSRKCECGHGKGKHFAATKGTDAGCEGNGHSCDCKQFSAKITTTQTDRSNQQ